MSWQVTKMTIWTTQLEDRPGATARKLEPLADVGADLQFVLGRRINGKSDSGVLLISPLRGKQQIDAAEGAGFDISKDLVGVKIEGSNKPGIGSRMAQVLAEAGINLQGFTAIVTGSKFSAFIAFDSSPDAEKGLKALRRLR